MPVYHPYQKQQPKPKVVLTRIQQEKKETLWGSYEVDGLNDKLKCWILDIRLRADYKFHKKLGLEGDISMSDLLTNVQLYISYEKNF